MAIITESYDLDNVADIKNEEIIILPTYIEESTRRSIYTKATISLIKYLKINSLNISLSESNIENILYQDNKSIDWISPIIFVGNAIITNPEAVKLLIDLVISYVSEKFSHSPKCKSKCSFVYEDKKSENTYKKITYEGDISGLEEVKNILSSIKDE